MAFPSPIALQAPIVGFPPSVNSTAYNAGYNYSRFKLNHELRY